MLLGTMQRLFTTFPNSAPGLALFVLRLSIGGPLIFEALYAIGALQAPTELSIAVARFVVGCLLCAGLWTPFAATVVAIAELWDMYAAAALDDAALLRAVVGLSLAMLGPGAWSVDARLFGRKRLKLGAGDDPI